MWTRPPSVSPEWFVAAICGIQYHANRPRPFAILSGLKEDGCPPVGDETTRQVGDMEKTLNAVLPPDKSVAFAI